MASSRPATDHAEDDRQPSVAVVINVDAMVQELCELARAYIARDLYVEPSVINVSLEPDGGGKVHPRFGVDQEKASGFTPERIQSIMADAYGRAQRVMAPRFAGVTRWRRDYYAAAQEGDDDKGAHGAQEGSA